MLIKDKLEPYYDTELGGGGGEETEEETGGEETESGETTEEEEEKEGKEKGGGTEESKEDEEPVSTKFLKTEEGQQYAQAVENWKELRDGIVKDASIKPLLDNVKKHDADVYSNLVHSIVEDIKEQDSEVYGSIMSKVGQDLARAVYNLGKKNNNEEVQKAARLLSKVIGGDTDISTSREKQKSKALAQESQQKSERERQSANAYVMQTVTQELDAKLDKMLPSKGLNKFLRGQVKTSIYNKLNETLDADMLHVGEFRAFLELSEYPIQVQQAFAKRMLNRASEVLPEIVKTILKDAKEGLTITQEKEEEETTPALSKRTKGNRRIDYAKTSDSDILDGNITYLS